MDHFYLSGAHNRLFHFEFVCLKFDYFYQLTVEMNCTVSTFSLDFSSLDGCWQQPHGPHIPFVNCMPSKNGWGLGSLVVAAGLSEGRKIEMIQ